MRLTNSETQNPQLEHATPQIAASPSGLMEVVETAIAEYNRDYGIDEHTGKPEPYFIPFTIEDYVYSLAGGRLSQPGAGEAMRYIEIQVSQLILASLNIPDPWPDLTREKLRDLVGQSRREKAWERGLDIVNEDAAGRSYADWSKMDSVTPAAPLTLQEKICAAHNRDWLMNDTDRKKAESAQKRREAREAKQQADSDTRKKAAQDKKAREERIEADRLEAKAEAERIERERIASENAAEREKAKGVYAKNPNFGRF